MPSIANDYSTYHTSNWIGPDFDSSSSGPVVAASGMRLRDETPAAAIGSPSSCSSSSTSSSSLSNCSFPPSKNSAAAALLRATAASDAVCSPPPSLPHPPPSRRSSEVVASSSSQTPAFYPSSSSTSTSSYHQHQASLLLHTTGVAASGGASSVLQTTTNNGSQFFYAPPQQQQKNLQHLSSNSTSSQMPKMMNEAMGVQQRALNGGLVQDQISKQLYYVVNNSPNVNCSESSTKMAAPGALASLNGFSDHHAMNGNGSAENSFYHWNQQNSANRQQQQPASSGSFYSPATASDYDLLSYYTNGQNGHHQPSSNGFSGTPPLAKKLIQSNGGFHDHHSSSSSTSSCYSGKNGFSNGINPQQPLIERSKSRTPPNDQNYQQPKQNGYSTKTGTNWSTTTNGAAPSSNGHGDVFSQMNTFDPSAIQRNGDGYYARQDSMTNGFSPEQSRRNAGGGSCSGSVNGSTSGSEHAAESSPKSSSMTEEERKWEELNTIREPGTGMRNAFIWLKNLRLHKYERDHIAKFHYDEFMQLVGQHGLDKLATMKKPVCEGARKKLTQHIQKLHERLDLLRQVERDLGESGGLKACALALEYVIDTPIKPYSGPAGRANHLIDVDQSLIDGLDVEGSRLDDANLAAHVVRVLIKACCKILSNQSSYLDDEAVKACLYSVGRVLGRFIHDDWGTYDNDSFTAAQKRRVAELEAAMLSRPRYRHMYDHIGRKVEEKKNKNNSDKRSTSWSKDHRRQSVGCNGVSGVASGPYGNRNGHYQNNTKNPNALRRQSSLGTNGLMVNGSSMAPYKMTASGQPMVVVTSASLTTMNHQNAMAVAKAMMEQQNLHPTSGSSTPSYASAVLGQQQRIQKTVERDENGLQCRPVQRTISAPPLRQNNTTNLINGLSAGGSNNINNNPTTCANNTMNGVLAANQKTGGGNGQSSNGQQYEMPSYCMPPNSVFSAGPTTTAAANNAACQSPSLSTTISRPPPSHPTIYGSAWSCGMEETSARQTSLHPHLLQPQQQLLTTTPSGSNGLFDGHQQNQNGWPLQQQQQQQNYQQQQPQQPIRNGYGGNMTTTTGFFDSVCNNQQPHRDAFGNGVQAATNGGGLFGPIGGNCGSGNAFSMTNDWNNWNTGSNQWLEQLCRNLHDNVSIGPMMDK